MAGGNPRETPPNVGSAMVVVLDTNVLISAFLTHGAAKDAFDHVTEHAVAVVSPYILDEFQAKCRNKLEIPNKDVQEYVANLRMKVTVVDPPAEGRIRPATISGAILRDPKDAPILVLAIAVKADLILTGDNHLLSIATVCDIPILPPREIWAFLKQREGRG